MTLTAADRFAITDLINLHGHLTDQGDFEGLFAVFTEDVRYDVSALGGGVLEGTPSNEVRKDGGSDIVPFALAVHPCNPERTLPRTGAVGRVMAAPCEGRWRTWRVRELACEITDRVRIARGGVPERVA